MLLLSLHSSHSLTCVLRRLGALDADRRLRGDDRQAGLFVNLPRLLLRELLYGEVVVVLRHEEVRKVLNHLATVGAEDPPEVHQGRFVDGGEEGGGVALEGAGNLRAKRRDLCLVERRQHIGGDGGRVGGRLRGEERAEERSDELE